MSAHEDRDRMREQIKRELIESGEFIPNPMKAMQAAIEKMGQSMRKGVLERQAASLSARKGSEVRFHRHVRSERAAGLAHVKAEAARVRRELGL